MNSLEFIRKYVTEWPEGALTVRLDRDGEICFIGRMDQDFYPSGGKIIPSFFIEGCRFGGAMGWEYTKEQWERMPTELVGNENYITGGYDYPCRVCGRDIEILEPEDFNPEFNYCGGSPSCCP